MYNPIYESVDILVSDTNASDYGRQAADIIAVLEDVNSPMTAKYKELLYNEVLGKAHINFGDIPKSKGNIRNYSGYSTMCDTIAAIYELAKDQHNETVISYCETVKKAIDNLAQLSSTYERAFAAKAEYPALEYNVYTYTCVEATTALLNSFVEFIRTPEGAQMPELKNTKMRADAFYFEQLKKFNAIQDKMGIEYRQMLENMCEKGRQQLVGTSTMIGVATVSAVALSIIPITRELIYQIYNARLNVADALDTQAKFLEMNADALKYKETIDPKKRREIAKKQTSMVSKLRSLSDKIRVKSAKSISDTKREIAKDNKKLSLDSLKDDVNNSALDDLLFV